jgi:hypothetical protein
MTMPREILEAAERIQRGIDPSQRVEWLDHLRGNGLALWPHTYGKPGVKSDLDALRALVEYVHGLPEGPRKSHLQDLVTVPSCCEELLSDCLWVDQCCPIVQTSHRFASAAVCTTLPVDLELKTPWRAWVLEIPDRLLWVEDPERRCRTWLRYCLVRLLQTEIGPRWSLTAMAADSIVQVGARHITGETLLAAEATGEEGCDTALDWPIDSEVDRLIACLKSLVANLLVTMSDPQWCRPVGKHQPISPRQPGRLQEPPQHRRFMVAKPTRLDVRQQVIDYCRGGRQPNTVQTLVRGHWHTVLHGPRKSLRRLQFFEPYWKGDLEAPISSPVLRVGC